MLEGTYAGRGVALGCFAAIIIWVFPLPVAFLAWLLRSELPFGDVMLLALPFLALLPVVGAIIGFRYPRRGNPPD